MSSKAPDGAHEVPAERLARRPLERPHPGRLAATAHRYEEILAAHRLAMREGQAGYADPVSGLFVLTAAHLAARGRCCGEGCRHCPFVE